MTEEKQNREFIEKSELWQYVENKRPQIENSLREHLPLAPPHIETKFNEAIEYALFSGGKRIRPVLTLLGAELVGGRSAMVLPAAAGVEFVHASSLIFDNLPCMNDAKERRGKVSLHEKYGEGLAISIAIGLLNAAYGLVFVNHQGMPERAMLAHAEIVECVGAAGMVGGQTIDLALAKGANSNDNLNYDFESLRNLKTSALTRLALRVGAILAGANYMELAELSRFAGLLGDAYQLSDDSLDLKEDGKNSAEKAFALNQTKETNDLKLNSIIEDAKRVLIENFPSTEARSCLIQLTDYLAEREA